MGVRGHLKGLGQYQSMLSIARPYHTTLCSSQLTLSHLSPERVSHSGLGTFRDTNSALRKQGARSGGTSLRSPVNMARQAELSAGQGGCSLAPLETTPSHDAGPFCMLNVRPQCPPDEAGAWRPLLRPHSSPPAPMGAEELGQHSASAWRLGPTVWR